MRYCQWQGLGTDWRLCNAAHHLTSVIMTGQGRWDRTTWQRRLESFGEDDNPISESPERSGIWSVLVPHSVASPR
jgi:hypothetical protein